MLIKCPECNNDISDKAVACPRCGFPLQSNITAPTPKQAKPRQPRKFRRLPNGFGSIKHLSGNRRNPYAAYPPTKEWNGKSPKSRPAIGYFKTYNDAYKALAEYNSLGISIEKKITTFSQVYEMFMSDYQKTKNPSKAAVYSYSTAFKKCESLHKRQFAELRKTDFQSVLDANQHFSKSTTNNIRTLFNQMSKIAIENDITDRNYASNVVIGGKEHEKGVPFTHEEIARLWENKDNEIAQIALIMIYSGYRAGELEVVNVKKDRFEFGLKTEQGKKRIVPIHDALLDFPIKELLKDFKYFQYLHRFYDLLETLGFPYARTGEKHTPHDCRHTFSWLADISHVDNVAKHMIMGHSLGTDIEANVYGHRTFDDLKYEINKIQV